MGAAIAALVAGLSAGCSRGSNRAILTEQYEFEADGQVRRFVGLDGAATRYSYDGDGRLTQVRFPAGFSRFAYDARGRVVRDEDGAGATEYFYDPAGGVAHVLVRRARSWLLSYQFDPLGNLVAMRADDLARAQADPALGGAIATLLTPGRRERAELPPRERAVTELAGRLEQAESSASYRVRYRYDAASRLVESQDESGITQYRYPSASVIERRLPNGVTTRAEADGSGRPVRVTHLDAGGGLLAGFDYAYSSAGQLLSARERDGRGDVDLRLVRDGSNRVARVVAGPESTDIAYDASGRVTSVAGRQGALAYDSFGRVIRVGDVFLDRDAAGRIERMRRGPSELRIRYDGRGKPNQVVAGTSSFAYVHDGAGRLVSVKAGGQRLDFLHDPLSGDDMPLLSWHSNTATVDRRYYALDPYAFSRDGAVRFTLRDGLGAARLMTDVRGAVVDTRAGSRSFDDMADSAAGLRGVFDRMTGMPAQSDGRRISWRAPRHPAAVPLILALTGPFSRDPGQSTGTDRDRSAVQPRLGPLAADAAELDRLLAEIQYLDAAGFYATEAPAGLYARQVEHRLTQFVERSRAASIDIYMMGVGAGWAEANRQTRERCGDGSCIFLPSFSSWPPALHLGVVAVDKILGTLPGDLMPRKLDYPKLLTIAAAGGKRVNSLICVSGCGLELQRDRVIDDLVRHAGTTRAPNTLPLIVVQSTDIGRQADRLRAAGYSVRNIGERAAFDPAPQSDGSSGLVSGEPDGIVPFLVRPSEEYLGPVGRVPILGRLVRPLGLFGVQVPGAAAFVAGKVMTGQNPVGPHAQNTWWDPIQQALTEHRIQRLLLLHSSVLAPELFDTFDATERALGGVELLARTDAFSEFGRIRGVHIDDRGRLVAVGDGHVTAEGIQATDLALALQLAYQSPGIAPQFSLDPADRKNPGGEWLRPVYYPDWLKGTALGQTMFDADWLMKQYSFGLSVASDGRVSRRATGPAGLPSLFDLSFDLEKPSSGPEHWTRLWIVVDRCLVEESPNAMTFSEVRMGVKGRRQVVDRTSKTGLRDVETDLDPATSRFATLLTEKYDDIAAVSPPMARLKELAKVVALANWLNEHRAEIDPKWVNDVLAGKRQYVERIQALRWSEQRRTSSARAIETRTIRLFGGVDLTSSPQVAATSQAVTRLAQLVKPHLTADASAPSFDVTAGGERLKGLVLPINQAGAEVWTRAGLSATNGTGRRSSKRSLTIGDTTWELVTENGAVSRLSLVAPPGRSVSHEFTGGRVVRTRYGSSTVVEYSRDTDGRLMGVAWRAPGGEVRGERDGDGTSWRRADLAGRESRWRFGPSGVLRELVLADGLKVDVAVDEASAAITARTADGSHTVEFAPDASMTHRWRTTALDGRAVEEVFTRPAPLPVVAGPLASPIVGSAGMSATTSVQFRPRSRHRGWFGFLRSRSALDVVYTPARPAVNTVAPPPASNIRRLAERFEADRIAFASAAADGTGSISVHAGASEFVLSATHRTGTTAAIDLPAGLESWFAASGQPGRLILSADGLSQPVVLGVLERIQQATGNPVVYLASDLEAAVTNLGRLRPLTGPGDLTAMVPESSFGVIDYDVMTSITRELRRAGVAVEAARGVATVREGDVIVVAGNKDASLKEYLLSLGEANAFRGKLVVLLSCNDPSGADIGLHSRLIREYGALGIHFVPDQINPLAVREVVVALAKRLERRGAAETLDRLFRSAVDAAARSIGVPALRREIQKLLKAVSQLSRLTPDRGEARA